MIGASTPERSLYETIETESRIGGKLSLLVLLFACAIQSLILTPVYFYYSPFESFFLIACNSSRDVNERYRDLTTRGLIKTHVLT